MMTNKVSKLKSNITNPSSRRKFIKASLASLALAGLPGVGCTTKKDEKNKMILSFYLDDTHPAIAGAEAYKTFLEYCNSHGIRGESSVILGYDGRSMADQPDSNESAFLELAKNSYEYGIDTHMEIMTHHELFDFETGTMPEKAVHEGLWLHEPDVTAEEYHEYFSNILKDGKKVDVKFTGLTWPGCGCEACTQRYTALREKGPLKFNPEVWEALISLVKQDRFRGRVIPIFYESDEEDYAIIQQAADGEYGVYDLMPNAEDHMGIWENTPEHVDPDYYISEDGKSGIIIRHLKEGAPYCLWYMHWQGLNPESGLGWAAFKTVNERIEKHLKNQVIWMRPSDMVTKYHDHGSWGFMEEI